VHEVVTGATAKIVITGLTAQIIVTRSAAKNVVTRATTEIIVSSSAAEVVIAGTASKQIVSGAAAKDVVTSTAAELVVPTAPTQIIVSGAAGQKIVAGTTAQDDAFCVYSLLIFIVFNRRLVQCQTVEHVVTVRLRRDGSFRLVGRTTFTSCGSRCIGDNFFKAPCVAARRPCSIVSTAAARRCRRCSKVNSNAPTGASTAGLRTCPASVWRSRSRLCIAVCRGGSGVVVGVFITGGCDDVFGRGDFDVFGFGYVGDDLFGRGPITLVDGGEKVGVLDLGLVARLAGVILAFELLVAGFGQHRQVIEHHLLVVGLILVLFEVFVPTLGIVRHRRPRSFRNQGG